MPNSSVLKKLLLLFTLLLVVLTSIGYFYYSRWQREVQKEPSIPYILANSGLVCELKSVGKQWNNFRETTIGQDFSTLPFFTKIQVGLEELSHLGIDKNVLDELSLVISVHGLSEEELGYVFYLDISTPSMNTLLRLLERQRKNTQYEFEARNYAGYTITAISQPQAKVSTKLYILQQANYVIASFSELLIEDIIRGLAYKASSAFLSVKKSPYKQGSLFINFSKIPSLLRVFLKHEYAAKVAPQLVNVASAAQLELKLTHHCLLLTGIIKELVPILNKPYWIYTPTQEDPLPLTLASYVPANAAVVQYYTFKNAEIFANGMQAYRNKGNINHSETLTSKPPSPDTQLLNEILKNDMALCTMGSEPHDQLLLVRVKNLERTMAILEEMKLITNPGGEQMSQWPTMYTVHAEVFKNWLPSLVFPYFEPTLLTMVDNCVVLGSNFSTLKQLHEAYTQGYTWAKEGSPQHTFLASTLESANLSIFVNLQHAWRLVTQKLKPTWKALLDKHLADFRTFGYISLQFANTRQAAQQPPYMNLLLAHIADNTSSTHWKPTTLSAVNYFQTEAPIITQPFFVETHKKEAPHLLVQDTRYQLYFVDNMGKLIWKKQLKGPILTDIFLIDFYKNNKWQYLCATQEAIHLIDYMGQEIKKYPQKLPQPGQGVGLNVIDYNHDKNYRLLITDERGNIYLKDMQYRPLPGWNPKALHAPFAITPFHIRIEKDYFLSLQENGMLHAFNRKGQACANFPLNLRETVHNPLIVRKGTHPATTQLIVLTEEGKLNLYNLMGSLQNSINLEKTPYTAKFILSPELVNGQNYTIFRQDLDKIAVLDEQGNLIFETKHETEQPLIYQYYDFGKHQFYVITDPIKNETCIYDAVGKPINNMPLDNSGQRIKLLFTAAAHHLIVYTSFNNTIRKYQLTIEEPVEVKDKNAQSLPGV